MTWKRLGFALLALALSATASSRPTYANCWEVGLNVNSCGSVPIKIYNTTTGALVFSGASNSSCTGGMNFMVDLGNECSTSSSLAALTIGTTYLFEFNIASDYKKALFVGAPCPTTDPICDSDFEGAPCPTAGPTCDSVFTVTPTSLYRTSGTTVHTFSGYPNATMLSATLGVASSQQIGSSMQYELRATATVLARRSSGPGSLSFV